MDEPGRQEAKIVGTALAGFRTKKFDSITALAEAVGCDISYISKVEKGQQSPTPELLERIMEALEIPAPQRPRLHKLNVLARAKPEARDLIRQLERDISTLKAARAKPGAVKFGDVMIVPCGGRAAADSTGGTIVEFDHTGDPLEIPGGITYVEVVGGSMEPMARHGQKVFIDAESRTAKEGDLVVVETTGGQTYFKRFYADNDHVMLASFNPLNHQRPIRLSRDEIKEMRVVVGVWFG